MKFTFYLLCFILVSNFTIAQQWWGVRTHVQLATDAEVSMAGVQPGVGVQLSLSRKLGLAADYYYYSGKFENADRFWPVNAWQKHHTLTLLGTWHLGRNPQKGMYTMVGMAWQSRTGVTESNGDICIHDRDYLTAAMELGYRWPMGQKGYGMAISLKTTGPLSYSSNTNIAGDPYSETFESSTIEILTQLSFGVVVDRRMLIKKK